MSDLIIGCACVVAIMAFACCVAYYSHVMTIQMYRDAFPDETDGLTDTQVMELDSFKNNF